MADESFDMQSEMVGELSTGDLAGGGLRAMFEAAGVPTDRESIDVAISGIPAYSLAEGVSGGRLSEMLEGLGQEASIEELITSMTDLPVEEAALAATAMGAMSPGSRFRSIGEALEEITKRVRDYFTENPRRIGPNEQRRMREMGYRPEEIKEIEDPETSTRNVLKTGNWQGDSDDYGFGLTDQADLFDMGLTDKAPDLMALGERTKAAGVDVSDIIETVKKEAIPTTPSSRYSDAFKTPQDFYPTSKTNPDFYDPVKYPERANTAELQTKHKLLKTAREDADREAKGMPPRNEPFRRRVSRPSDQQEIDFDAPSQEGGLPSVFDMLEDSMNPRSEAGLDAALRGLNKDLDAARRSGTMPKGSSEFTPISRGKNAQVIDSLRAQLEQERGTMDPETVRSYTREITRLLKDNDVDPDLMAKGGRPGTRRRKKIMVPSSYKAGGQVFQKGYYGKTYK
tara:strand:- start:777 stop:2141 length:1365 start_codon:yes stop_codon:yes gene_type:complete